MRSRIRHEYLREKRPVRSSGHRTDATRERLRRLRSEHVRSTTRAIRLATATIVTGLSARVCVLDGRLASREKRIRLGIRSREHGSSVARVHRSRGADR